MIYHNTFFIRSCAFLLVLFVVFWSARIWSVNQRSSLNTTYDIGQIIDGGDLSICATESLLLTREDFANRFDLPEDIYSDTEVDGDGKIVAVCINVTNTSGEAIEWDEVIDLIECGFETKSWASGMNILYGQYLNRFYSSSLESGASQDIWFATDVNKQCFKEKSWANIDDAQFYYVLSLEPYKVQIRLNT